MNRFKIFLAGVLLLVSSVGFSQIVAGGANNSATICKNGSIWTWGLNDTNDSSTFNTKSIIPTELNSINDLKKIELGEDYFLALKNNGTVWIWGKDISSSSDLYISKSNPKKIDSLANIVDIKAGKEFALALKNDGTVWAWGSNLGGALGDYTNGVKAIPEKVPNVSDVKAISVGAQCSFVLKNDGTVWAWGYNYAGQLGIGVDGQYASRRWAVKVNGLSGITSIKSGRAHTLALKDDGTLLTMGYNSSGQLGINSNISSNIPVVIPGIDNVKEIAVGDFYSMALKKDGTVWAWGKNDYGQLGDGTKVDKNAPTQIVSLTDVAKLNVGDYHAFAVKCDGTKWGWGRNDNGQIGNGTVTEVITPQQISLCTFDCIDKKYKQSIVATNTYSINGNTYTTSGVYIDTLVGASSKGCDSIVTTNLNISEPSKKQLITNYLDSLSDLSCSNFKNYISDSSLCKFYDDTTIWLDWDKNFVFDKDYFRRYIDRYDYNGKRIMHYENIFQEGKMFNDGGIQNDSTLFKYDDLGRLKTQIRYDRFFSHNSPGSETYYQVYYYHYNENSNVLDSITKVHTMYIVGNEPTVSDVDTSGAKFIYTYQGGLLKSKEVKGNLSLMFKEHGHLFNLLGNSKEEYFYDATDSINKVKYYKADGSFHYEVNITNNRSGGKGTVIDDYGTYTITKYYNNCNQYVGYIREKKSDTLFAYETILLDDYGRDRVEYASYSKHPYDIKEFYKSSCFDISDTIVVPFVEDTTCKTIYVNQDIVQCNSIIINGINYDSSQVVIDTLNTVNGCDSIITTNLRIKNYITTNQEITTCGTEIINGNTYSSSQTIVDTLTAINSCDSIVTTDLIIITQYKDTAYRYECKPTSINGIVYSKSTELIDTLTTSKGCDSIVLTKLTIEPTICNNRTIASGSLHSLALCEGNLFGWGSGQDWALGDINLLSVYREPVPINTINNIASIGGNTYYSAVLKNDGTVWHWGYNEFASNEIKTPTKIYGLENINNIAVGGDQSLALKNDGTVWAWGLNDQSISSAEAYAKINIPVRVDNLKNIIQIANHNNRSLALKEDGTVWSWNYNYPHGKFTIPKKVDLVDVTSISVGSNHFLALKNNGTVWQWKPGIDSILNEVTGLVNIKQIKAGRRFSLAITNDNTVVAWGDNSNGKLGNGNTISSDVPVNVTGLKNIVEIETYYEHCTAKDIQGNIWSWGNNSQGQLGDGTTINRNVPVLVKPFCNVDSTCVAIVNNQSIVACDSIKINDKIYIQSQTLIDTLFGRASNNCDSIVITELTITTKKKNGFASSVFDGNILRVNTISTDSTIFDFGDGNKSVLKSLDYTYKDTGTYYVCLITYNECGSDSICTNVKIDSIPKDSIIIPKDTVVVKPVDTMRVELEKWESFIDSLTHLSCSNQPKACSGSYYNDTVLELSHQNSYQFDRLNNLYEIEVFNANGRLEAEYFVETENGNASNTDSVSYHYDSLNRLIKERKYEENGDYLDIDITYNSKGDVVINTSTSYTTSGVIKTTFKTEYNYEYNLKGKKVKETIIDPNRIYTKVYEYDINGNVKSIEEENNASSKRVYHNKRSSIDGKGKVKLWLANNDTTNYPDEVTFYNSCNQIVGLIERDVVKYYLYNNLGEAEEIVFVVPNNIGEEDKLKHIHSQCYDKDTTVTQPNDTTVTNPIDTTPCFIGSVSGMVYTDSTLITDGTVILYTSGGVEKQRVSLVNGSYNFTNVLIGGYSLYAEGQLNTIKLVPEYYDNALNWQNVKTFNIACRDNYIADFILNKEVVLGGSAKIKGVVGNASEPKEDVKVFLFLESNPTVVLQATTTDSSGIFEFENVPNNSFIIKIDAVGANPLSVPVTVANNQSVSDLSLCVLGNSISECDKAVGINDIENEKVKFTAYPNPFQNEITIQFELEQQAEVELAVYNTLGQKVAVLINDLKDAGIHKINYNSNQSSLIYILQLRIGDEIYFKRISKVK